MGETERGRWAPGTAVVQEEYWRAQLVTVRPVTVVQDTPSLLALFSHAGAVFRSGALRTRRQVPLEDRTRTYLSQEPIALVERSNRFNVLTLNPPGASHAFWLFWDQDWRLSNWYVNLQPPFRRHSHGVSTGDYLLDLVITPDLHWSWKDEDEFEAVYAAGGFSDRERAAIRAEGRRAVERIEAHAWPFDSAWPDWRADREWPVPTLPTEWRARGQPDAR